MKRRLYIDPESGYLEECSPDGWESERCVVLRGHTDLWQRYLDAERARDDARQAVIDAAIKEPMTAEESALHERALELNATHDLDWEEWRRRDKEIREAARQLAESDACVPAGAEQAKS